MVPKYSKQLIQMKDLKYLLAYIAPLAAYLGIYYGGIWSLGAIYIGYVMIPLLESFLPKTTFNHPTEEEPKRLSNHFFDILLYLNIPLLFGLLWYFFSTIAAGLNTTGEIIGMTFNVGIIVSIIGINVAHELGHRNNAIEQTMSKMLLMTALYMHFNIEHNLGHHKNVATEKDPASARQGENVYGFIVRSTFGGYFSAWEIENKRLKKLGLSIMHWRNQMIWFHLIQMTYLFLVGLYFGWIVVPFAIAVGVLGFVMLELINYIEHYGLQRKKLASGRYENVSPKHSWNSDHEVGRIFLYELTRHSDHHYKANRKYQILRRMDESPQLPYGYPTSILISFVPPLWFHLMDKEVLRYNNLSTV